MDVRKILSDVAAIAGPSGQELQVAEYFAEQFRPLVDEVRIDSMFNVIAHKKALRAYGRDRPDGIRY